MTKEKDRDRRAIFDGGNHWIATAIEQTRGVWRVLVGNRDVGSVGSVEAAKRLIDEINGERDGGGQR